MRGRRVLGIGSTAALVCAIGLASTVSANSGAVSVSGLQTVAGGGDCPGATFVMAGDLVGCWTVLTFEPAAAGPNGILVARGTEFFDGCLGTQCGTISLKFTFTGKFDAGGVEVWGGCRHQITSGTGDFAGVTGAFTFVDVPDGTGLPPATYIGRIAWPAS